MIVDENEENEELEEEEEELSHFDDTEPEPEPEVDSVNIAIVREDKIFNNRYNSGDGLPETEEYSLSRGISVNSSYSDAYLRDIYNYEEQLEIRIILDTIFSFLQNDPHITKILKRASPNPFIVKPKLSKDDINFIFNHINTKIELKTDVAMFFSPIYILEVISSITSIEYKKLFDTFETEIQELLLTELNKKYKFLEGKMHKKRIH